MIAAANALEIFRLNITRTDMLIEAVDKIAAYNWLYQQSQSREAPPAVLQSTRQVQDGQLECIRRSCTEHAIVSLATAFETYYTELLQEVLSNTPDYFTRRTTKYSGRLDQLLTDRTQHTFEDIADLLKLRGRKAYYGFFRLYDLPLLDSEEEADAIEYLHAWRNHFVHNANRPDAQRDRKLKGIAPPVHGSNILTETKRLRSVICALIGRIDERVKAAVAV
jgi:hypothetical protein